MLTNPAVPYAYDLCSGIPISQLLSVFRCLFSIVLYSVLIVSIEKLVGHFNQEKALVGVFSMIVKNDGSFAALVQSCSRACGATQ